MRGISTEHYMQPEIRSPSTVFGLAAYNGEEHLAEALESLVAQTRRDLAVVVVDDASTDRTGEIVRRYAELDPRVSYERNDRQLGLVRNWRRVREVAADRFPDAPYFAWASDHDVWHPRWLESTAAELDTHPEAVLAYPFGVRIDDFGSEYPTRERPFETEGIAGPALRVRRTARNMTAAGEMIYGLMRREALDRAGEYPLVVLADRLQLLRLAAEGEFRQVRRRLWYRRYRAGVVMTNRRQRRTSFPSGAPLWAYLPWSLTHALMFVRSPGTVRLAGLVLLESARHAYERSRRRGKRRRRWRRRERRQRLRALLGRGGEAAVEASAPVQSDSVSKLAEALDGLERGEVLDVLAAPGAVLLELGTGGVAAELAPRLPGVVSVEFGTSRPDLAVSVGAFDELPEAEAEELVRRLYELGTPVLYSLDRESPALRAALGRRYWLRDVWVPREGATGRKPDPTTGRVPRELGRYRHLVGRRRLILTQS
jgi:Glycosyl transferase family 2